MSDQNYCPLCKNEDIKLAFVKAQYEYFNCPNCECLYVYPMPSSETLQAFYNSENESLCSQICWTDQATLNRHAWDAWDVWMSVLDLANQHVDKGNVLDIGCGCGPFLAFAKTKGWNKLYGIEWNAQAAHIAAEKTQAVIYSSTEILKTDFISESFSVVMLWDIAEHLNNIDEVFREVFRLLEPGGVVCIGTVHRYGASLRMLGKNALTVNPPEHLLFFTKKGINYSLKNIGFNVVKSWSFLIYLREWFYFLSNFNKKTKKIDNTVNAAYLTKKNTLIETNIFLKLIGIANTLLKLTNLGDELVVIAQKPKS